MSLIFGISFADIECFQSKMYLYVIFYYLYICFFSVVDFINVIFLLSECVDLLLSLFSTVLDSPERLMNINNSVIVSD